MDVEGNPWFPARGPPAFRFAHRCHPLLAPPGRRSRHSRGPRSAAARSHRSNQHVAILPVDGAGGIRTHGLELMRLARTAAPLPRVDVGEPHGSPTSPLLPARASINGVWPPGRQSRPPASTRLRMNQPEPTDAPRCDAATPDLVGRIRTCDLRRPKSAGWPISPTTSQFLNGGHAASRRGRRAAWPPGRPGSRGRASARRRGLVGEPWGPPRRAPRQGSNLRHEG